MTTQVEWFCDDCGVYYHVGKSLPVNHVLDNYEGVLRHPQGIPETPVVRDNRSEQPLYRWVVEIEEAIEELRAALLRFDNTMGALYDAPANEYADSVRADAAWHVLTDSGRLQRSSWWADVTGRAYNLWDDTFRWVPDLYVFAQLERR